MSLRGVGAKAAHWAASVSRGLQYGFYDFTREMPRTKRMIAWAAILIQGYMIFALVTRSFVWPIMWPRPRYVFVIGIALFYAAYTVMNGLLASELVRKTQLESDQSAEEDPTDADSTGTRADSELRNRDVLSAVSRCGWRLL